MVFCRFYNGDHQDEERHCPLFREEYNEYGEIEYYCALGIQQKEKVYKGYYEPFCNLTEDKVEQFSLKYERLQSEIHYLQNLALEEEQS